MNILKCRKKWAALCLLFFFIQSLNLTLIPTHVHGLSIDDEAEMGANFLAQIRKYFEFVADDFANQYINDLGQYLIKPVDIKHFPYHFYIVKDGSVNAFAAPGGHIFFFSGLIQELDDIDEFASVMCHEIGHVYSRHLSKRLAMSKKIGLATLAGVLAGALIGGPVAQAMIMGSQAVGIQSQLHYSREDERQADQLGLKYTRLAGFDPNGMLGTLQKLNKGYVGPHRIPAYLLTHPTGPERIALMESLLSRTPPPPSRSEADLFRKLYPFFKTVVTAKSLEPREAESLFLRELSRDPEEPESHFGLGIVYSEMARHDLAIDHLKKALARRPRFVPILTSLGAAYLMNGRTEKALEVLEDALERDDRSRAALFLLGLAHERLDQYDRAIRYYERLVAQRPFKNDVYYHLGISYGRQNRLALAHYNFGRFFSLEGKHETAGFHFRKAKQLAQNDPALSKKIQREMDKMISENDDILTRP
jgi:predicted Zn-dependent protease